MKRFAALASVMVLVAGMISFTPQAEARRGWGFGAGIVAAAVVGGAIAASAARHRAYAYYPRPYYYGPSYYYGASYYAGPRYYYGSPYGYAAPVYGYRAYTPAYYYSQPVYYRRPLVVYRAGFTRGWGGGWHRRRW